MLSDVSTLDQRITKRRGLLLVLSSPSGAGKTTISRALLERHNDLVISISATTRPKRPGEEEGVHYHFLKQAHFDEMVAGDQFLEHATVFNNSYGTLRQPVMDAIDVGQDVVFDVDWQGASQIRARAVDDLVSIFILPPSLKELEVRLRKRAQDTEAVVQRRMSMASLEMSHWSEYEYIIVNDSIQNSIEKVDSILAAERLKRRRQIGLTYLVRKLGAGKES